MTLFIIFDSVVRNSEGVSPAVVYTNIVTVYTFPSLDNSSFQLTTANITYTLPYL